MTAPTVKDFSGLDFDFAVGEVYGLRMWNMDEYGRLRARNWGKAGPWRPGVNVAKCHAEPTSQSLAHVIDPTGRNRKAVEGQVNYGDSSGGLTGILQSPYTLTASRQPRYSITWDDGSTETYIRVEFRKPDPHEAPAENCQCGFYAYSTPEHPDAQMTPGSRFVYGVIKGTGRTLIGTKGFRCEKAEILCLLDPTRGGRKTADWRAGQVGHLKRVYPDVPLLPSRADLLDFAPIEPTLPDPSTDEFWSLP